MRDRRLPAGDRHEEEMDRLGDLEPRGNAYERALFPERGVQCRERLAVERAISSKMGLDGTGLVLQHLRKAPHLHPLREGANFREPRRVLPVHEDELDALEAMERRALQVLRGHAVPRPDGPTERG